MQNEYVGYAYLIECPEVEALTLHSSARIMPVTKKQQIENTLAIPVTLKPADILLDHVLFALKHEGLNLQVLAQVMPLICETEILEHYEASPTGKYIRITCLLWEHFNQQNIQRTTELKHGKYVPLLDPKDYITGVEQKNARWRVTINIIGSLNYCVSVRRTPRLEKALAVDVLEKAKKYTESLDESLLNRALSWAYLSETRDSFAIEKELPDTGKIQSYTNLLKQAHKPRNIDEDYLIELQNATISNQYEWAMSYRNEQNYLSNGSGSIGVTYVPPEPELCRTLMSELEALINDLPDNIDPIVLGAIISFGFVFLHPFMDGNGRLSRFLFHHVLCRSGKLVNGLLLPVSAVLYNKERQYLKALTDYSFDVRQYWQVDYLDTENFTFTFQGHDAIYRYWDGTTCAELMAEACEEAMEDYIKKEVAYLKQYDTLKRHINNQFDINDKTLSKLVIFCLEQKGTLSKKRRDQFKYQVPEEVYDALEKGYLELFDIDNKDE